MSKTSRAVLTVVEGPNSGDTVSLDHGICRLIGRHLSESETSFIDRDGNRVLDPESSGIISEHLKDKAPAAVQPTPEFRADAYERGSDVVLADDSISRAHAMIFFDDAGLGLIDLASTNGTFVNNERVGAQMVLEGDSIKIGQSVMLARLEG
ncbi:MAG: FHA domain-containing protein [Myxococcota bacterium]